MARNLSSPLAKSEFDYTVTPKKKKKRTTTTSTNKKGDRTLTTTKRSGAKKSVTISPGGSTVTRKKTNRKGEEVKSRTSKINSPTSITYTTKKKGKPTKTRTSSMTKDQQSQLEMSPGNNLSKAKQNRKKADRFKSRTTEVKDAKKADRKVGIKSDKREARVKKRTGLTVAELKNWRKNEKANPKKLKRKSAQSRRKKQRKLGKTGIKNLIIKAKNPQLASKKRKCTTTKSGKVFNKRSCKGKSADGG